ncbi:winged helix DNA-binding domain-containing protein [Paraflavitalea pollutisoli]|uniref:winged helix DNA-binding domain-containing protein n=1 Tax=Paraflavitalea pollutisoli TaxID=3034143 RepID=UPI0023EBA585|nr:winged helix DNA-binding domain-containing protein [Paraflavitalea sp. H1-2-19X]
MTVTAIAQRRLVNQRLFSSSFTEPAEVVHWLGAMQAQDFAGAKWSIGTRLPGITDGAIEQAIDSGKIIRTWALRGTWHWVSPVDVHWMLSFVAPRVHQKYAKHLRDEGIDKAMIRKSHSVLNKSLEGGAALTRDELAELFVKKGIKTSNYGVGYLLLHASQERLICMGPRKGKQFTHVLLDEWAPTAQRFTPDEPLAELARRYFISHGPATAKDFMWWAGITLTEARKGIELVQQELMADNVVGETYWQGAEVVAAAKKSAVYLLPGFDEFLLGYTDRSAVVNEQYQHRLAMTANGQYSATIVVGGQVVGIWKRTIKGKEVVVELEYFEPPAQTVIAAVQAAARRYARFLGLRLVL